MVDRDGNSEAKHQRGQPSNVVHSVPPPLNDLEGRPLHNCRWAQRRKSLARFILVRLVRRIVLRVRRGYSRGENPMKKPAMPSCELLPDEHIEGEETLSSDELTAALTESLQGLKAWNAGRGTARVTVIEEGKCIDPREMTKAELADATVQPQPISL